MRVAVIALTILVVFTLSACSGTTTPNASSNAQGCPTSQPATLSSDASNDIAFETSLGTFVVRLAVKNSPIAVSNLTALASCHFYDNVIFHRIAYMADGTPFVIQGGDPTGTGSGGPGYFIKDEPVTGTYRRGVIAMARSSQPDSQGSQFFIVLDDAAAVPLESARTYAIMGEVISGMDVVDAIAALERRSDDSPIDPPTIISTTVTPTAP
jgi:cyclophilin family peptidyl-prolyl cis-trans isomerase